MGTVIIGNGGHARDIAAQFHHPMIAHHSEWDGTSEYIIGINDPHIRAKVAADLGGPGWNRGRWIHPTVELGTSYVPNQGMSFVGDGTHINYGVTMTRTQLGQFVTVAPGVTICGDVTIGDRVFIGAGAVITNLLDIGDDAVIGAGSVVLHDVPAGATVVGNPARIIKGRT